MVMDSERNCQRNILPFRAEGFAHANLNCPFRYRNQQYVHNANAADQHRNTNDESHNQPKQQKSFGRLTHALLIGDDCEIG